MHIFLSSKKPLFDAVLDHLHKELGTLRTGRATPQLVEDIRVSAYDSTMELKGLASISVQDAKTIVIDPWDKGLTQAIEKAIRDEILEKEKNKDMSEDEKFKLLDELEKLTKEFNEQISAMGEKKEDEIMTV